MQQVSVQPRPLAQGVLLWLLLALLFLWPFELPMAVVAHALLFETLGDAYVLTLHAVPLALVSVLVILLGPWNPARATGDWRWFALAATLYLLVGFLALAPSSVQPVAARYAYQQLLCGFLTPVVAMLAVAGLEHREQQRLWTAFFAGWIAFLLVSIGFLWMSWNSAMEMLATFRDAPLAQRLLVWRYTLGEPWNVYGLYLGNANKMSNYLVIFLLLSVTLLSDTVRVRFAGVRRLVFLAFWILATGTLVVLFSRAALLLLPIAFMASGTWSQLSKDARRTLVGAFVLLIVGVVLVAPGIFAYLFTAQLTEGADTNPLGSYEGRFEQWSALETYFSEHPLTALLGMGTTGYGERFVGTPEAGTHNMFLDLWSESGVLSPLLMLGVLLAIVLQALNLEGRSGARRALLVGIVTIVALMTREHSPSYLFVTSLGGLCFAVMMYIGVTRDSAPPAREDVLVAEKVTE